MLLLPVAALIQGTWEAILFVEPFCDRLALLPQIMLQIDSPFDMFVTLHNNYFSILTTWLSNSVELTCCLVWEHNE
jgi:hypothetical protein